ncbi:MAG: SGNH/GDSL hydrolase family protein [Terriglobales bacterium]
MYSYRSLCIGARKLLLVSTLVLAVLSFQLVIANPAQASADAVSGGTLRVMPLGDSITEGNDEQVPGAYRPALWDIAAESGNSINFVGSQRSGPADLPAKDHEGFPGLQIQEIDARAMPDIKKYRPDVILLHAGTNNIWRDGELPTLAPQRLSALVNHIVAAAPHARVYVAGIVPSVEHDANVRAFNKTIPGMIADKASHGAKVFYVDQYSPLTFADLIDGIHPNKHGYRIMAEQWWAAMRQHENLLS